MTRLGANEFKWFALLFGVIFALTAIGQYLFVRHQTREILSRQLTESAEAVSRAVDYKNGVDLKAYNRASINASQYLVVLNGGGILDAGTTPDLYLGDLIPEVSCPPLEEAAYLKPMRTSFRVVENSEERWWLFAIKLDRGTLILGISDFDEIPNPEKKLKDNAEVFGSTVEKARHVNSKQVDNAIQNWAIIRDDGRLVGAFGRIPMKTDPMTLGRVPLGLSETNIEGKPILALYTPLRDSSGKAVGTMIFPQDVSIEESALRNQVIFNAVIGGASFLLFLVLAVVYSTKREREKRAIREAFQHYFSPQIMDAILREPDRLKLGGVRREVTILFSDIRSFTALSERLPPQQLTRLLQEYFGEMADAVFATDGILDKYIGDAIMAFWGAPIEQPDQADRAVRTALDMEKRLKRLQEKWTAEGLAAIDIGIGINLGIATVGNFGSASRFDYTVMGDTVNAASRLEALNKDYHSHIIISESTMAQLTIPLKTRDLGEVNVRGKEKPIRVFEVLIG